MNTDNPQTPKASRSGGAAEGQSGPAYDPKAPPTPAGAEGRQSPGPAPYCLENLIPELLELARGVDHDDEECPQDDTCTCDNIAKIEAELRAVAAQAPASSPRDLEAVRLDISSVLVALALGKSQADPKERAIFEDALEALARLHPPKGETPSEAAGTRKVAAALYAQARANGKLYWQYRRSGVEHPWPLIAKERRLAYWNAAGIVRVVGAAPGTAIEKAAREGLRADLRDIENHVLHLYRGQEYVWGLAIHAEDANGIRGSLLALSSLPQEPADERIGPRCGNCGEWCQFCREGKEGAQEPKEGGRQ